MSSKKKSKSNSKSASDVPVSLVTITQLKRKDTIKLLAEHINAQTYKNIVQWVIVEGSKNLPDALENEKNIEELKSTFTRCEIDYIPAHTDGVFNGYKLGKLRNVGNSKCTGDITVCMDDDDYYFPTRVAHCVERLTKSKALLAGCSDKFMYDYCLRRLFKFKSFGPNHSTNDCMAWKKEYLLTNSHDPNLDMAEEASFTKQYANEMVQLEPEKTIVSSSHSGNTFNKKDICMQIVCGIYPYGEVISNNDRIKRLVPKDILTKYENLFSTAGNSPYDIVYFTGGRSIDWDPSDQSLGGSEQAVVNLSTEWAKSGKKVAVYGKVPEVEYKGVDYFPWNKFNWQANYNVVVLWRLSGVLCFLPFDISVKKLYVDYHDNRYNYPIDYLSLVTKKVDKVFFKSNYHRKCYIEQTKHNVDDSNSLIIPNGIRINDFKDIDEHRNPYRFCYCSCYTRGLMEILAFMWPVIYQMEPRAELHVYYGMNHVPDEQFMQTMQMMLSQPGVMDHGRMPVEMIAREKSMSTFHLYITETEAEIDCISIRESLVAGCVPLLSNFGVFADRDGLHFDIKKSDPSTYENTARNIVKIMHNRDFVDLCRENFKKSKTIVGWNDVADDWLSEM